MLVGRPMDGPPSSPMKGDILLPAMGVLSGISR
jgi:hypothetical protein